MPEVFLKTGLTDLINSIVKKTGQTFAGGATTYHDVPTRSYSPQSDKLTNFASHYDVLPPEYKDAPAYFRFKGLLIPINDTDRSMNEDTLLAMLHK